MACGIIPDNRMFGTWDIPLRTEKDDSSIDLVVEALLDMEANPTAIQAIRDSVHHRKVSNRWPAFVDLITMWSDWLPFSESSISTVVNSIGPLHYPMTETYEARVVW